jgi:hypothetical protein
MGFCFDVQGGARDANLPPETLVLDIPALAQRIIYPRTHTPEAAWAAATNSGYAGAIMATSHMMLGGLLLFSPAPVAPGLIQLGVGFVYILFARLAFSRSRFASIVIVGLIILDILVESLLAREFGLNHVIILVALVLAIGGLRGANAIFSRHGKPRP